MTPEILPNPSVLPNPDAAPESPTGPTGPAADDTITLLDPSADALAADTDDTVTLGGQATPPVNTLDPAKVADRALQYHIALGWDSPGKEEISKIIVSNYEKELREQTANKENAGVQTEARKTVIEAAKAKGGMLTPDELRQADKLWKVNPKADPAIILEYLYGHRAQELMANVLPEIRSELSKNMMESPNTAHLLHDLAATAIGKTAVLDRQLGDLQDKISKTSLYHTAKEFAWDFLFGAVNTARNYDLAVVGLNSATWTPSGNLDAQKAEIWNLPLSAFNKKIEETVAQIEKQYGPEQALRWLVAMRGVSSSQQLTGDLFAAADVWMLGSLAKSGVKLAGNVTSINFARQATAAAGSKDLSVIANKMGDTAASSRAALIETFEAEARTGQPELVKKIFNPDLTSGKVDGIQAARLSAMMEPETQVKWLAGLVGGPKVKVYEDGLIKLAIDNAQETAARVFDKASDAWAGARHVRDPIKNTVDIEHTFRNHTDGMSAWKSKEELQLFAENRLGLLPLSEGGYKIGSTGVNQYEILVRTPLDYSATARGLKYELPTTSLDPPQPWFPFMKKMRSAQGSLAERTLGNRGIVDSVPNEVRAFLTEWYGKYWKPLGDGTAAEKEVITIIKQFEKNNVTREERGIVYTAQSDLNSAFIKAFGKPPTEAQSLAYFMYNKAFAADWVVRDLLMTRDFIRQGVMQYRFSLRSGDEMADSGYVLGKSISDLPSGDFTFWFQSKGGRGWGGFWSELDKKQQKQIADAVKKGDNSIIEMARPTENGLAKETGINHPIEYVITKNYKVRPIQGPVIDHNPNQHKSYGAEAVIGQGVTGTSVKGKQYYSGSMAIHTASFKDAPLVAEGLDTMRELFRTAAAVKSGVAASEVMRVAQQHKLWTGDHAFWTKWSKEVNLDNPIRSWAVNSDFHLAHADAYAKMEAKAFGVDEFGKPKSAFENMWEKPNNLAKNMDRAFTQKRSVDISHVGPGGSRTAPMWELNQAATLNPVEGMMRGFDQAIHNTYMGDLRAQIVEDFAKQYHSVAAKPKSAANDPYGFLHNPKFQTESKLDDAGRDLVQQAKEAHARHMQYMGLAKDKDKLFSETFRARMLQGMGRHGEFVEDHLISKIDDLSGARNVMFFGNFGFHPLTYLQQAISAINAVAIGGSSGLAGAAGAAAVKGWPLLHGKVQDAIAKGTRAFGWDPHDLKAFYELGLESGWFRVGNEAIAKGDARINDLSIRKSNWQTAKDLAAVPYNMGEGVNRYTSWFTAAHEWRKMNPGKAIDDLALQDMSARLQVLSGMMNKSYAGALEQGLKSVPFWYTTFSRRMMELYFGGAITPAEKLRLFATHMVMFGAPAAATGLAPVWPWYDSWRETAIRKGWPVDHPVLKTMMEGFPAYAADVIWGLKVNPGKQFGANPIRAPKDMYDVLFNHGEGAKLVEDIFGALGRSSQSYAGGIAPFFHWARSKIDPYSENYPLSKLDALDLLRNMRIVDAGVKMVYGLNHHKYYSRRSDTPQADITTTEAMLQLVGITPNHIVDQGLITQYNKKYKDAHSYAMREATIEFQKGIQAYAEGDKNGMNDAWKRVKFHAQGGDLDEVDQGKALAKAYESSDSRQRVLDLMREFEKSGPKLEREQRKTGDAIRNIQDHLPWNKGK